MPSLLDRIKNASKAFAGSTSSSPVQKSYSSYPLFGFGGMSSQARTFPQSEYGAALASQLIPEIQAGLNVYTTFIAGLTWQIKDRQTGEVYQDSTALDIDTTKPGARFMQAVQDFQKRSKHNYWKSSVYSDFIAGETYIYRVRNVSRIPTGLMWLNPLTTEPVQMRGVISYYQYNGDDSLDTGYRIETQDMAYRMFQRNMFNDLRGNSPILAIIRESNLSNNVKKAFENYFKNGMILGGILAPAGDEVWSPSEMDIVRRDLLKNNKGLDNAESWILSQRKLDAQTFDGKDASKDFEVLQGLRQTIMLALGVSEELAGMPTNATYENLDASQRNFYKMRGIPYVREIADFHNTQILPHIEPGQHIYLTANTAPYETERPEIVSQDVTAGFIDIRTAQEKRGHTPDDDMRNVYLINGRPMHKDTLLRMAMMIPGEELVQQAEAATTPVTDDVPVSDDADSQPEDETVFRSHDSACTCSDCTPTKLYAGEALYPDEDTITARIDDALQTWKRYARNRYGKKTLHDFESDIIPAYIRHTVIKLLATVADKSEINSVFNGLLDHDAIKNRRTYRQSIRRLARGFWTGDLSEFQFTDGMNSMITREYTSAFQAGVKRGGLNMDELTPNEKAALDDLISEEVQNAFALMLDLRDSKKESGGKLADIRKRVDRWVARYDRVEIRGYIIASRDKKLMWKISPATESCKDCLMLDGRVYRASTWAKMNIEPASPRLDCFGLNCGCILIETDDPVTKGRPPRFAA
ncbi:MAG: phage portal protein [Aggregatilineales bacterium]